MRGKFILVIITFLFLRINSFSQNISLVVVPKFGDSTLRTFTYYKLSQTDSVQITALKFYISGIELWKNNKLIWKQKNSYRLVNISEPKSLLISLDQKKEIRFDEIRFDLGIDSLTNVSGALGGDLDPSHGMYWTWQSGYINLKLEGNSNLCKTRNNEFQFHLGGYQKPFSALTHIVLRQQNKAITSLVIDIKKIMNAIDLKEQHHIMSPSKEAVQISELISKQMNHREP